MRIGAALSTDPDPAKAGAEAAGVAGSRLDGADASLALLVASRQHAPSAALMLDAVRRAARPERVMGCFARDGGRWRPGGRGGPGRRRVAGLPSTAGRDVPRTVR